MDSGSKLNCAPEGTKKGRVYKGRNQTGCSHFGPPCEWKTWLGLQGLVSPTLKMEDAGFWNRSAPFKVKDADGLLTVIRRKKSSPCMSCSNHWSRMLVDGFELSLKTDHKVNMSFKIWNEMCISSTSSAASQLSFKCLSLWCLFHFIFFYDRLNEWTQGIKTSRLLPLLLHFNGLS